MLSPGVILLHNMVAKRYIDLGNSVCVEHQPIGMKSHINPTVDYFVLFAQQVLDSLSDYSNEFCRFTFGL